MTAKQKGLSAAWVAIGVTLIGSLITLTVWANNAKAKADSADETSKVALQMARQAHEEAAELRSDIKVIRAILERMEKEKKP